MCPMQRLRALLLLLVLVVAGSSTLAPRATASIYTPRDHRSQLQASAHVVRPPCVVQKHTRSIADASTQQGRTITLGCEQGYRAYVLGDIFPTNGAGTVNGYFKFYVINVNTGFSYWVSTGNFSKPATQCLLECYFQATYTPTDEYYVEYVQLWADHNGEIGGAWCEEP
jgi:hypothetical protein